MGCRGQGFQNADCGLKKPCRLQSRGKGVGCRVSEENSVECSGSSKKAVQSLGRWFTLLPSYYLYYLRSNSLNFVKQNDVGAAPCGRPQDAQPLGVVPTISVNNVGFPSVWLRLCRAKFICVQKIVRSFEFGVNDEIVLFLILGYF
jgi:hypothetical protein